MHWTSLFQNPSVFCLLMIGGKVNYGFLGLPVETKNMSQKLMISKGTKNVGTNDYYQEREATIAKIINQS